MKVLVTGGAGFVGTNLIKRLLGDGHSVISVDNYTTGLKSNHQKGCVYIEGDIRNFKFPFEIDMIFHMAAIARIQPSFKLPEPFSRNVFKIEDVTDKSIKDREFVMSQVKESNYGFFQPHELNKFTISYNINVIWDDDYYDNPTPSKVKIKTSEEERINNG